MPGEFEFNDKLIAFFAEEIYNCKYGDFFFNCEQERIKNELRDKTFTIWFAIDMQKDMFKNNFYVGLDKAKRIWQLPVVSYEKLRYWREYYSRYTEPSYKEDDFMPDAQQQLTLALEKEVDVSILLT